jgi:hypothetical protein
MGPIGSPETSVRNYYSLRNNLEGLSYNQLRGGSLKSRKSESVAKLIWFTTESSGALLWER